MLDIGPLRTGFLDIDPLASDPLRSDPLDCGPGAGGLPDSRPRGIEPRGIEPLGIEPLGIEPLGIEPRGIDPRGIDPRGIEPRGIEPRDTEPRDAEPHDVEPGEIERSCAAERVRDGSHLTLHYRLTLLPAEVDLVDTFESKPATLQLGIGQLAEPLERLLYGLSEGDGRVFELAPGAAFGQRQDGLVMRLSRAALGPSTAAMEIGEPIEVLAPDGKRVVGIVRALDDRDVTLDFNHPLAGQAFRFTVRLIGIL